MSLLSHYTNERALIGICRSQCLWATNFLSLNDEAEFFYALSALQKGAFDLLRSRIPDGLIDNTKSIITILNNQIEQLKTQTRTGDGYGDLYIASFAQGRTADENDRGVLTLWDRYTQNKGFCLQFEREDIANLVQKETMKSSYFWLELCEVKYGIDKNGDDYKQICEQLSMRMQKEVYLRTHDRRLERGLDNEKPDDYLFRMIMSYCGKHKDPAFIDEREVRILAYPAPKALSQPFLGIVSPKTIHQSEGSIRALKYIALGEHWIPGVVPTRVIVGPKAELDHYVLSSLYPSPPTVVKSNIPIR